jgi:hypothetical protein
MEAMTSPSRAAASALSVAQPMLALLSLSAAAIHFAVIGEHFDEWFLAGVFFSVIAWLQALWSAGVLVWPSRSLLIAGAVGNLVIAVIWTFSRTTGLPIGPDAGTPEAVGFADVLSTALELLIVAGCAVLLASKRQVGRPSGVGNNIAIVVVTVAVATLTTAAIAVGTGHQEAGAGEHHGARSSGAQPAPIAWPYFQLEPLLPEGGVEPGQWGG